MSSTTALSRDCTSMPPADRTGDQAGGARIGQAARRQKAQVLLFGKDRAGGVGCRRRDDDLGEDLRHLARGILVDLAVDRDDAAEGADRIAAQTPRDKRPSRSRRLRRRTDWRA